MVSQKLWRSAIWVVTVASFLVSGHAFASHSKTEGIKAKEEKYQIALPVLFGVTQETLTPNFGEPRGNGTRSHEGLDIFAPVGTPIVSPVKATVEAFGIGAVSGKFVFTKGADGHRYWYMHLDEIAKLKHGQKLKVGDLIGTVGDTGNAKGTEPHLHFEIRKKKPIDPYLRIKKDFSLKEKVDFLNKVPKQLKEHRIVDDLMIDRFESVGILAEAQGLQLHKVFTKGVDTKKDIAAIQVIPTELSVGSEGDDVKALQRILVMFDTGIGSRNLAYVGITGYFGTLTRDALMEFQKKFGLVPDGILTRKTKQLFLKESTKVLTKP